MNWSLELIRDGFCVGLGFWAALGLFLVVGGWCQRAKRAIDQWVRKRVREVWVLWNKPKEIFKRQIDER